MEESKQIRNILEHGTLLNPVRLVESVDSECVSRAGNPAPLLVLVDLGHGSAWNLISTLREPMEDGRTTLIAVVDPQTESLMDRAYDAGVKSYLRKPFSFSEFVLRARLLELNLVIQRPGG